jgi:hypothetical protein
MRPLARGHGDAVRAILIIACSALPALGQTSSTAVLGEQKVTVGPEAQLGGGGVVSNRSTSIGPRATAVGSAVVAGDVVRLGSRANVGTVIFNVLRDGGATVGAMLQGITIPITPLPPPVLVQASQDHRDVAPGTVTSLPAGSYGRVRVGAGATVTLSGDYDFEQLVVDGGGTALTTLRCQAATTCRVRVASRLSLAGERIGNTGGGLVFDYAGSRKVTVGRVGSVVRALIRAPLARVDLKSAQRLPASFTGQFVGRQVKVGHSASVTQSILTSCGNAIRDAAAEQCDGPDALSCPGACRSDCRCPVLGTQAILHSVGPTVLHNATDFGIQIFGQDFLPGAMLQLSDKTTGAVLATLPMNAVSTGEATALVPAGLPVASGIERELTARVLNPGSTPSLPPDIGACAVDLADSPIACTSDADCPPGAGSCIPGKQRLTLFDDLAFLNPSSAALVPPPHGLCDDGTRCQSGAACAGIGSGACSPKLYVTPQQRDELWVFHTGTGAFADQSAGASGIQGIPIGDNPFHVEILDRGLGVSRAWVVNRFEDSLSIIDTATDTEVVRLGGSALGVPGHLEMETEIEFNRARTRAYLSNENLDEVQVLDISGARLDAPVLLGSIDVGVNPRGMTTNADDTRLYVANIQSADISVVDIEPGSPTENQVLRTISARAPDDIVGGRADGWEDFVISGRAPRGSSSATCRMRSSSPASDRRPGRGRVSS